MTQDVNKFANQKKRIFLEKPPKVVPKIVFLKSFERSFASILLIHHFENLFFTISFCQGKYESIIVQQKTKRTVITQDVNKAVNQKKKRIFLEKPPKVVLKIVFFEKF